MNFVQNRTKTDKFMKNAYNVKFITNLHKSQIMTYRLIIHNINTIM
jgi:hypothetical protein